MRRNSTAFTAVLATFVLLILAACSTPAPTPTATPQPTATVAATATAEAATAPTVKVVANIAYLTPVADGVEARSLDVYFPEAPAPAGELHPVIVFAHGYGQRKDALVTVSKALAAEGAVVFVPSWPAPIPSSAAEWREGAEALACTVQYARAYAGDAAGDPANITLVGFSAGGAFGAHVALAGDEIHDRWDAYAAEHDGPPQQVACTADASPAVQHFVGIGGAYSFADRFQATDPDLYDVLMTPAAGRALDIVLMQGEFDSSVPPAVARMFQDYLVGQGFSPELVMYDSGHTVPRDETVATVMAVAR